MTRSHGKALRSVARLAALAVFALAAMGLPGCGGGGGGGGSFGVSNGTIRGTVLGIVGGVGGTTPLSGVRVTATRVQGGFAATRTATSDATGQYSFFDVPLGTWDLTFQLLGFDDGGTTVAPVQVVVGSGSLAAPPDVVLLEGQAGGGANVTIRLIDDSTGFPITGAAVTVGGFPPSFAGADGRYFFDVPVAGPGIALPIQVTAAGATGVPVPNQVTPVVGFPVELTVSLSPTGSFLTGTLQANQLNALYLSSGALAQVSITSTQVSQAFLNPIIDPSTGQFSVRVPASVLGGNQFIDLLFTSPFFQQTQVAGILTPGPGGTQPLSSPVVLSPQFSTLQGQVLTSFGAAPTGIPNEVVVVETGARAVPVNGGYVLSGVPSGLPLTLQATTLVPPGAVETGVAFVTPLPGVFTVAPIITG